MSGTFDFERMLGTVLDATGPTVAPETVVATALAQARSVGQRHRSPVLDRRSWPPRTISVSNPAVGRLATIAIVALLLAAMAGAAISIGSQLLRQPTRPVWLATGSLNVARDDSAMVVRLADGRVLALGGRATGNSSTTAEVYDPVSNTWTAVSDMPSGRTYGTATLLPDGMVLVAGGGGDTGNASRSAALFDPTRGTWTRTGDMFDPHNQHAAILLRTGEVLVAGGANGPDGTEPPLTAELYNPITRTWRKTRSMVEWRASPTITLLPNGTVLVVEGFGPGHDIRSAETYDPATEVWTATGNLTDTRADDQTATLLPNGKVLVVGGYRTLPELYDPARRSFTTLPPMPQVQRWHIATLLPSGLVLFAGGGYGATEPLSVAVLYDPADGSWTPTAPLVEARMGGKAVLLLDGSVLAVGGYGSGEVPLTSVERFGPRPWSLFGGD